MNPWQVQRLHAYTGHAGPVYALCQGWQAGTFISAGADGIAAEWTLGSDDSRALLRAAAPIYSLCLLPGGLLAAGQNDGGLLLYSIAEGQLLHSVQAHSGAIFALEYLPGQGLLAASADGSISLWQAAAPYACLHRQPVSAAPLRAAALHPDGHTLALAGADARIHTLALPGLRPLHSWPAHGSTVFGLGWGGGGTLYSTGRDAHLKLWQAPGAGAPALAQDIVAHSFAIHHVAVSADGALLATGSMDKTVKLWDAATRRLLKVADRARHQGHTSVVNRLLWCPDGTLLSASDDRSILHWRFWRQD